ncbi:hypothetical protein Kfla_1050 [Kribbella flavida DSM 17836]|uniref:Uncharacterized protein n=1 Tax=Kribbella flavida (strain DSM 17836 / JCM 10339 / NBRC 14399) TaxID=479435 RepID=D2Q1G6_KRIFD|nr:hypothetical protein [Kribbella flavida]ADB30154.1 hypothetical protein Kfla_1050 [Kribbella flavida DSM 17836]
MSDPAKNPTDDPATGALITRALSTHADSAPADDTLLTDVHTRLRRRRVARTASAVVLACAAVATTITGIGALGNDTSGPPAATSQPAADGWHWESYRTVQVQVPDGWADSSYSHLWTCPDREILAAAGTPTDRPAPRRQPLVGRPYRGAVFTIDCGPVSPLPERVPHLWFGEGNRTTGVTQYDHGWADEVRIVNGIRLTVFSNDPALRRRILDSAEPIGTTDAYGCAPTAPDFLAAGRPPSGPGLTGIGEVSSIKVCAYAFDSRAGGPALSAGDEITGDQARRLTDALRAAPEGSGPNEPYNCRTPDERDDILLTLRGSAGEQQVALRHSTCDFNGIDDGSTHRRLTRAALLPLVGAAYPLMGKPMVLERLPR